MTTDNPIKPVASQDPEEILNPDDIKAIVKREKDALRFGVARKLLTKVTKLCSPDNPCFVWYHQQLALCTYKDEERLPAQRFGDALQILERIGLRSPETKDAETLALGGAVYKRRWEYDGQLENLHQALFYYRAAFERHPQQDQGYGGINAAFVLTILADRVRAAARRSGVRPREAHQLDAQADDLRHAVVDLLTDRIDTDVTRADDGWRTTTLAEAYFGLQQYADAGRWLARSRKRFDSEWQLQTAFRQLVSIARLHGIELPAEGSDPSTWHAAWQALTHLLGGDTEAALACHRGKVGLALSGGGLRASFYHLGVLARLAEMDVLRSVETLSTVSGGSIVGAHYYLEVRRLLTTKADGRITRQDYIDIVRRVLQDFLDGTQTNIRMRALADFRKALSMIINTSYSRSHRLGELYEEELFAAVPDGHEKTRPRPMHSLLVRPADEDESFHPKFNNWRRRAKVPALLLNATSLNTGHNWHFTARSMGEPPGLLGSEVDKNTRYRRMWYEQAPTADLKNFRLGYAVAASACVPGLFEPLTLEGLFPNKVVRLVDGGVHDNQGVAGLLDEGCTFLLCSDASGQMQDVDAPSNGVPAVLMRANAIMMDRVREAEYQDLRGRTDSRAIQGLFFVHLKKDLPVRPQDWAGCQDPTPASENRTTVLPYGIDAGMQQLIASLRTDLDAFSEVEAYALMGSGYLMTEQQFKTLQEQHERSGETGTWGGYQVDAPRGDWPFLALESMLKNPDESGKAGSDLRKQLEVGGSLLFKVWKLDPRLKMAGWVGGTAAVIGLVLMATTYWSHPLFSLEPTVGALTVAAAVGLALVRFPALKWLFPQKATRGMFQKAMLALFGYLAARIHLWTFNGLFLERGSLKRLLHLRRK